MLCKCGCGLKVKPNRIFIFGHHIKERNNPNYGKVPPHLVGDRNPGKHPSEETKQKMGIARLGKHHSEESKEKMRIKHLGKTGYWQGKKRPDVSEWLKKRTGPLHPNWKSIGSIIICLIGKPKYPRALIKTPEGWIERSRFVMGTVIGRQLEPWELVHHKDRDTLNDDPANLEVMSNGEHGHLHHPKGVRWKKPIPKRLLIRRREFSIPERRNHYEPRQTQETSFKSLLLRM